MSNYYGSGRSNYFAVKDIAAFKLAVEPHDFRVHEHHEGGTVCVLSEEPDGTGSFFRNLYDEDDELLDEDWSLVEQIVPHLKDGEVAVLIHVGSEKMRYLSGYAVAVHSDGRTVELHLEEEIIARAKATFGVETIDGPSY